MAKTKKQINDEKAAKYSAEIEKIEAEQRAKGKIFNPYELLSRTDGIKTVNHPTLGQLRFGELTFEDAFLIDANNETSDTEKTEFIAWLMMKKAYPDLPKDFLKRMPLIEGAALIDFLTRQPCFLLAPNSSLNGSKTTVKRKTSG